MSCIPGAKPFTNMTHVSSQAFEITGLDDISGLSMRNNLSTSIRSALVILHRHQIANWKIYLKLWYTVGSLQCTALFMTKLSLLILFHRIFVTPAFRLATKILGVIMALWWIGTFLADNLICLPIEHNWNPAIPARCGNKQLVAIIPPIPWIITDLVILLMPVTMVWKLHLPVLQRVGLVGLFLLGGLYVFSILARLETEN